jgi:hypothetical protein
MNPFETFQTLGLVPKNVYQVRYPNILEVSLMGFPEKKHRSFDRKEL